MLGYALRPKLKPARDEVYAGLVRQYRTDDEFAALVRAVTSGLDLVVLDCDERHGLGGASTEGSVFAVRMTECAKRTSGRGGGRATRVASPGDPCAPTPSR